MGKIKVIVKIRPGAKNIKEQWCVSGNTMKCPVRSFTFDKIFGPESSNADIYTGLRPMIEKVKNGHNVIVFSYGQKQSGKTHIMLGTDDNPGVDILAIQQLFEKQQSTRQFVIRVGYIEIFNEVMCDLLNRRQTVNLSRRNGGDVRQSNKEVIVTEKQTILRLLQKGNNAKTPKSSADAPASSHTIFQIIIESQAMENEPIQIGRLSLVDLDRSEGAQVKDERGHCMDKSLECLGHAITALSKGEKFRNYSKSKLTRLFKVGGNADIAIICNVTPTSLNQTISTLNFADAAKNVNTNDLCSKLQSKESVMELLRADIIRLMQLKADLQPLLQNTGKLDDEIAELKSVIVKEKDMKAGRSLVEQESGQVLKIRPFFASIIGTDKKFLIGEMKDKSIDAQSRSQRKNNAFKWTDFYLERVGFELNLDMRRHLKYGRNIIGRSDESKDVDICIDSLECSRKHCYITVSDDSSISLEDLNSSNGTTINSVKYKGTTIDLHEGDVISIVGGIRNLLSLVGNYDCTVYRLCKTTNSLMQTYEIDDDIVVIDDDGDDSSNETSYFPVKMELELETPPLLQPSQSPIYNDITQPEVIAIDDDDDDYDDNNDCGISHLPVKMELETPQPSMFVEVNTEPTPNDWSNLSPNRREASDFDLDDFVFENVATECIDGITNVAPIVADVHGLGVPDLRTLAGELEELSKLQLDVEHLKSLESKIEQLKGDLDQMKKADEANKFVISELNLKLLASTLEKNALTEGNLILSSNIDRLKAQIDSLNAKLEAVEKDRAELREKNMKHIKEIMEHFDDERKNEFMN